MIKKEYLFFFLWVFSISIGHGDEKQNIIAPTKISEISAEAAFQYFLEEVELDITLTHEQQQEKILEYQSFADQLVPAVAPYLTHLLLKETKMRIQDILENALLEDSEIDGYLAGYEKAINQVQNMNVEIARQMLFFVAELKIHRRYVYEFGCALGCLEKQLLRHDLCKLNVDQFEGYVRYFRGGRHEEEKEKYLAAWAIHQYEEHHYQSYSKDGFSFDNFSEERIKNNMIETVADWLAASKQRGGTTLIYYLLHIFPKQSPHIRLLPHLEDALKKAHAFYLESENPHSEYKLFKDLPCWNLEVENVFRELKENALQIKTQ